MLRAEDEERPQLDLELSYGLNGLGGSFSESFDAARSRDDNNWSLGLVFRTPWPDRQAKGAVRRQQSALRAQKLQAERAERRIVLEISGLYDRLQSSRDQIQAGQVAVALAEVNLENEREKFKVQKATVHNLLQLEAELQEAQLSLARFSMAYQKVIAELDRARGALLDRWSVELE